MAVPNQPYTFHAYLDHVWDGDTIWLEILRGEGWKSTNKYRLYGVDTPEVRGKGVTDEEKLYAEEAKSFVGDMLLLQSAMVASTHQGDSKYDWLVELWVQVDEEYELLSDVIINSGHGVPYSGGTKLPWSDRKAIQDAARKAIADAAGQG